MRSAVAVVTVFACTVVMVARDPGFPAEAAEVPAAPTAVAAAQTAEREPSPLTLALEDDGTTLVARGTGDDPTQPVVIQAEDGAILATCVGEDECAVEVPEDESSSFIARAGDSFSEPVVLAGLTPAAVAAPANPVTIQAAAPVLGTALDLTEGTSGGWDLSIGTRMNEYEYKDNQGYWWFSSPFQGATMWYEFYATATPGASIPEGAHLRVRDLVTGHHVCWDDEPPFECHNPYYASYDGPQHDVAVEIATYDGVSEPVVIAQLIYDGWYDRSLNMSFTAPPQIRAGDTIHLTADIYLPPETNGLYETYIQEVGSGDILARCASFHCEVDTVYYTGVRSYRAYIASTVDPSRIALMTAPRVVPRGAWTTGIYQYGPVQGGRVAVIAPPDQEVGKTAGHYAVYIVDVTADKVVHTCTTGHWCIATVDATKGHAYGSVVAASSGVHDDVQAVSPTVYVPSSDGGTMRNGVRWETSGGYNPSIPSCQTCAGDPVNTYTGEFWDSITDLSLGELAVTRSYGSTVASVDGPFGHGWSDTWGMRLQRTESTGGETLSDSLQLVVVQENGSFVPFSRTEDGFATAQRVQASLEQRDDDTFAFARKDGLTYVFAATGELTQITDRNGNTRTLTYADGHVSRVSDDRGRFIDLTWTDGHVTAATDSTGRTVSYTYDDADDLVSVTAVDGAVTTYEYDDAHRIVAFTDARGARVENVYQDDRVVEQTDALDRVTTFAYDIDANGDGTTVVTAPDGSKTRSTYADGAVVAHTVALGTDAEATTTYGYVDGLRVSTTDPLGHSTTVTYDSRGNTTSVTDPLGRTSTTTYDDMDLPLVVTDAAGGVTTATYDDRGNLLSTTDPTGSVSTSTVNPDGTRATSTDPLGRTTAYTYDAFGNLATVTDPAGAVTATQVDAVGRVDAITDARGGVTTYAYDTGGRVVSTTDATGETTTATYDVVGNRLTATAADGAVTSWEYDLGGQVTATVDAGGARTSYQHDPAGRVVTVIDDSGAEQSSAYDAAGLLASSTDALDRTTTFDYDLAGRLVSTSLPSGATTGYAYNAAGQQTAVTDPLGAVATTSYDLLGRPVIVTDADGRAVTTGYDPTGRVTSVTRGDGSVLTWTYDAAGQQTAYVDAAGATTGYTYDAAGRTATRTDAAGRVTAFGYDPVGNLVSTTAADGTVTTRTYDALSRVSGIDYVVGTPDVAYTYDAVGRRTSMLDGTGTTTYAYDAAGRATQIAGPNGTVGYAWDDLGRLTTLTYPDGGQVSREYDAAGQLTSITDWVGGVYELGWTEDGQQSSLTYPNGVTTTTDYDAAGQVTGITTADQAGAELLDLGYEYSVGGLQTAATTERAGVQTSTADYTWDPQGRLASIAGTSSGSVSFTAGDQVATLPDGTTLTYDAAGQVTTATKDGEVTTFGYDGRGNRVSESGATQRVVSYDAGDRVTTIHGSDGSSELHAYSGDGLRASLSEIGATGDVSEHDFVWDVTAAVPLLLTDGTERWVYGLGGVPVAQAGLDDSMLYLFGDTLGSVRAVIDASSSVVAESDYDPYGRPVSVLGGHPATANLTRFGFAGEYSDASGFVYLRARHLDPRSGQFLTVDPLVDISRSIYGYADGNPLQRTDALGLWWDDIDWGAVVTVGIVVAVVAGVVLCTASVACAAAVGTVTGGSLALAGGGAVGGGSALTISGVAGGATLAGAGAAGLNALGQGAIASDSPFVMQNESSSGSSSLSDDCVDRIANGHAFDQHATELGVRSPEELEALIRDVVRFGERRSLDGGRSAWWSDGVGVIRDPGNIDMGTVFRMSRNYFTRLD